MTNSSVVPLKHKRQLDFSAPLVMGVLNITPDSFSDGGEFMPLKMAVDRTLLIVKEGADIIDIGGESSRPGAKPISADEEQFRILPVIKAIRKVSDIPISVDTYKASTARLAIEAGADIINDISALRFDNNMAETAAELKVPIILMHMLGTPNNMQQNPAYDNVTNEIITFFEKQINYALLCGVNKSNIIVDPGIGFGKRLQDNLEIINRLEQFKQFDLPLLVGASRKAFIGSISDNGSKASNRIGGSIAAALIAIDNGADIIRVHDVAQTVEAIKVSHALRGKK